MKQQPSTYIWVNTPKYKSKVIVDAILYCQSSEGKVSLIMNGMPAIEIIDSLSDMEGQLAAYNFFRCHRKYLLNLDCVEHFSEKGLQAVIEKHEIPVARDRKEEFLKRLMGE